MSHGAKAGTVVERHGYLGDGPEGGQTTRERHDTPGRGDGSIVETVRADLVRRLGAQKCEMWFGSGTDLAVDDDGLRVVAATTYAAEWIERHFLGDLRLIARDRLRSDANVTIDFAETPRREVPSAAAAAPVDVPTSPAAPVRRPQRRRFEEFVVGSCNELAYVAARRLAEDAAGGIVSPLTIHGECGVGKTHLLQALHHRFIEVSGRPGTVRYVTGEQFTNEYLAALRNGTVDAFRTRLRKLSLLCIDDIHFLSNKTATQNEFLHTLDAIDLSGARVALASDEHPRHLKRLSQQLVSRFMSGMIVRIDRPDRDTRLALLRRLAADAGLEIHDAAMEVIVANCVGSIRELEGVVTRLAAVGDLMGGGGGSRKVGVALAEQLFAEHGWRPGTPVRMVTIIDAVCDTMTVDRSELMGSTRHQRVVIARGLVAFLARTLTNASYPEIGRAMGRRNHSTAHTADQRVQRQMDDGLRVDCGGRGEVSLREVADQLRHEILRTTARGA